MQAPSRPPAAGSRSGADTGLYHALVRGGSVIEDINPDEARAAIAEHCRLVVHDPQTEPFLFDQAAKLVVDWNVYIRDLHHALEAIELTRKANGFTGLTRNGHPRSPGRLFLHLCRKLAKQAGVNLLTGKPIADRRARTEPSEP